MYIPPQFSQIDRNLLFDFVEQHSFGLLVSSDKEPTATHMPLLLDRETGSHGTLIGHMAKANPHWRCAADSRVLCVFSGPHAYISPTWYQAENVVPTWNYVAVHVYGNLRLVEDEEAVLEILQKYVAFYERSMPKPWSFDSNGDFAKKLVKMVVGFKIEIERIEGKWKLNQNHPPEKRENVVQALKSKTDDNSRAIAEMMVQQLADRA